MTRDYTPPRLPETSEKNCCIYSHLFKKRGAWNKRGGGAKVAKLLNWDFLEKTSA